MGKKSKQRRKDRRAEKPTYLGLLNAIAVGERQGDALLSAWRDATAIQPLAEVLNFVAIREREHAAAFEKRLCELGFSVRNTDDGSFNERLELARSDSSDVDKFAALLNIRHGHDADDPFGQLFEDKSIDPQTGALLGRYIAEERDSLRRLTAACAALAERGTDPVLDDIAERLDRLTATLEELKSLRR